MDSQNLAVMNSALRIAESVCYLNFRRLCLNLSAVQMIKELVNYSATELPEHLKSGGIPPFFRVRP